MSPNAEDGSPSPEPDFEHDLDNMTVDKIERDSTEEESPQGSSGNVQPAKLNPKDPSRPRRKKARRACFACQRAHLTCGDERPCMRCIKRGLQDQCHDGVRKKAKYLHDAPPEALMPGFAGTYHVNGAHMAAVAGAAPPMQNNMPVVQPAYYQQSVPPNFQQYAQVPPPSQMQPPLLDGSNLIGEFASQSNIDTPTQYQSSSSQQVSPAHDLANTVGSSSTLGNAGTASFDSSFFDANDPSLFNFNVSDLNFGNHYGALEFGMLGHLSGAVGTPELDILNPMSNQGSVSYDVSNGFSGTYGFNPAYPSWQNIPSNAGSRQGSATGTWPAPSNGLDAYAIGEQGSLGLSPHSQGYSTSPETQYVQPEQNNQPDLLRQSMSQAQQQQRMPSAFPGNTGQDQVSRKRRRDTAEVYSSVQAPYSYTQGFHALTAFLQKRFPPKKVLRIAKALANIRPSFISCNQSLDHGDLIFMEKCFQRTLYEYEDFVNHYGTPTVICRRTGEIAAVSKEFSLVTGWRGDVLLGKEPNLNVNTGGSASGTQTGTSSRGAATPRIPNVEPDPGRPQPVFLAELLDEDSVVQFYDDFAELAFGASGTSIIGAPCSLLKYRTKEDPGWGPNDHLADDGKRIKRSSNVNQESLIKGPAGMNALGERDGRVECSMCWTVKRDVFGIPMLIVLNFLPII
ncbi:Transcriptional regulator of nonfermentable carbon utilization [Friedmanniomyces endolithicus]|nr:Transcriptional regulator of nonfermentable carbon utilization [Friedmanniomyces endolithicus]